MRRLPSLFLSHGSPMMALEPSPARTFLAGLGSQLPRPRAILVVSAHHDAAHQGGRATVTASTAPPTIHDFGGFPEELFAMRYPAPGDPVLAARVVELLAGHGLAVTADPERGLDHGAWVPFSLIYPDADIPVVQLSIASNASPEWHYALGQALTPLRDEGVLIVGSGDIVHNLRAADFRKPDAPDWAVRFNDEAKRLIAAHDHQPLIDYATLGDDALWSINSAEHYLPLLYVLAQQDAGDAVSLFNDAVVAAISMTSIRIG